MHIESIKVKRLYRRFPVELSDPDQNIRLEDLSLTGMRIHSNHAMKLEESFETAIRGFSGPIQVKCRIVRACLSRHPDFRYEYGAAMVPSSEDEETRLAQFIQDLSRSSQPLPESPEAEDLTELQIKIQTLQSDLADLMKRHQLAVRERDELAAEIERRPEEIDESLFATSFTTRRFRHLTKIGQPLLKLVPDPTAGMKARRFRLISEYLTQTFDLPSLSKALAGKMSNLAIVETLWDLYEDGKIDFA